MKRQHWLIFFGILTAAVMTFIFTHSMMSIPESAQQSLGLLAILKPIFDPNNRFSEEFFHNFILFQLNFFGGKSRLLEGFPSFDVVTLPRYIFFVNTFSRKNVRFSFILFSKHYSLINVSNLLFKFILELAQFVLYLVHILKYLRLNYYQIPMNVVL